MTTEPSHLPESDFLRLFVRNEEALRASARALLPTWEAVDEVMQEASVVMWKKLAQLGSADGFLPWAKVIVRFEALRLRTGRSLNSLYSDLPLQPTCAHSNSRRTSQQSPSLPR